MHFLLQVRFVFSRRSHAAPTLRGKRVAIKRDATAPHSKTQARQWASNHGHVLECGSALPLSHSRTSRLFSAANVHRRFQIKGKKSAREIFPRAHSIYRINDFSYGLVVVVVVVSSRLITAAGCFNITLRT